MADEIAEAASAHTAVVGRAAWDEPEPCHSENATHWRPCHIRHHLTGYHDALADLATQDPWDDEYLYRQVKAEAHRDVDEFLAEQRRPTTCPYRPDLGT